MGLRSRLFALTYDRQLARSEAAGLADIRARLLASATGAVLEIGAGTGLNLRHYGTDVSALTLTEPEAPMLRRLERQLEARGGTATVLRAPAEDLPFEDDTFDTVVSTLVLCGVDDQPRALRQIRRVLRPGGQLMFLEHVRSDEPRLARKQDRMNPLSRVVACCDCNRPTLHTIEEAGFVVTDVERGEFPKAPAFVRPLVVGRAMVPATDLVAPAASSHRHSP